MPIRQAARSISIAHLFVKLALYHTKHGEATRGNASKKVSSHCCAYRDANPLGDDDADDETDDAQSTPRHNRAASSECVNLDIMHNCKLLVMPSCCK